MSSTRVLILRHGQSVWNAEGRWQGQADIDLTDHGREQARLAAGLVASECPPFEAVVSSDLVRAASATADGMNCMEDADGNMPRTRTFTISLSSP